MDLHTKCGVSLCSGVGMLDEAVRLAFEYFGCTSRVLAFCERDAYAQACLLARMEEASLEQAAICDSIEDIDGRFRGVDFLCAGFPCQDISNAGKRKGIRHGTRSGLWFEIVKVIKKTEPQWLFLENVSAIVSGGLDRVLGTLAEMGFAAEWGCLTAAAVGASHKRERWFCVAHRMANSKQLQGKSGHISPMQRRREREGKQTRLGSRKVVNSEGTGSPAAKQPRFQCVTGEAGERLGNANGSRSQGQRTDDCSPGRQESNESIGLPSGAGVCEELANAGSSGFDEGWTESAGQQRSAEIGRSSESNDEFVFAPGPSVFDTWSRVIADFPHLAPAVKPGVCVLADGMALVVDESRADQLRCGGNGVVPLQAAAAFVELMRRIERGK